MFWAITASLFVNALLTTSDYTCSNCHTASILLRGRQVASVPCSGSTPFCRLQSGTCSAQPDHHCGEVENESICTENGFFPDVECTTYHICKNGKSTRFNCTIGSTYNAEKQLCEINGKCGTFNCSVTAEITPHSFHSQYYAKCFSNGRPPLIYKCPEGHNWSSETKRCEAYCVEEGLIADLDDCTKYFICEMDHTSEGVVFKRIPHECPEEQGFDLKHGICVLLPSQNLPNCLNRNQSVPYRVKRSKDRHEVDIAKNDLFCLEDGLFPAENCHEYYSCKDYSVTLHKCEDHNEVFNPMKGACHKRSRCGQYNCTSIGRKAPHTIFPTYYTYCGPDVQPLVLGRCQDKLEMDYTTQNCINVCRSVGLKPDPSDCLKYYRCHRHWVNETYSIYTSESLDCPNGLAFDPLRLNCSRNYKNCT